MRNCLTKYKYIVSLVLVMKCAGWAQDAGQIEGKVRNEAGGALPGVAVVWFEALGPASSSPNLKLGHQLRRGSTITDEQGHYSIPALAAGRYVLCATAREPRYLSSCEFRQDQQVATVGGPAVVGVDFLIKEGCVVTVQLHDPAGRLDNASLVVIASHSGGSFAFARSVSRRSDFAEMAVTVPLDGDILLNIDTPFPLADAKGGKIQTGVPFLPVRPTGRRNVMVSVIAK